MSDAITERAINRSKMEISDEVAIHISDMKQMVWKLSCLEGYQFRSSQGRAYSCLWSLGFREVYSYPMYK